FQDHWHIGTTLLCLAAFGLADAPLRSRRWAGAIALLTAAVVGDPLALAFGVGPVVGGSALRALRTRRARDVGHAIACGVTPVAAAVLVRLFLTAAGGFRVTTTETSPVSNVVTNLRHAPRLLGALLGVGRLAGLRAGEPVHDGVLEVVAHAGGAVLFAAAVVASTGVLVARAVGGIRRRTGEPAIGDGGDGADAGEA